MIHKLPSGAELNLTTMPPFADSKALFTAILKNVVSKMNLSGDRDINGEIIKELFCNGLSSPEVDAALQKCMERALYNGQKIVADTFEKEEARQDYIEVCWQVAERNIFPFLKGLFAKLSIPNELVTKYQA